MRARSCTPLDPPTYSPAAPATATTEYARLSRALMLYQLGRVSDAILQLQVRQTHTPCRACSCRMVWPWRSLAASAHQPIWNMQGSHGFPASLACPPPGPGGVAARLCRSACRPGIGSVRGAARAAGGCRAAVGAWRRRGRGASEGGYRLVAGIGQAGWLAQYLWKAWLLWRHADRKADQPSPAHCCPP